MLTADHTRSVRPMHTPGPWAVHPVVARVEAFDALDPDGGTPVCEMLWPTELRTEAETDANARLIAAAPDLLQAAKEALAILRQGAPGWGVAKDILGTAIAKAEGRT